MLNWYLDLKGEIPLSKQSMQKLRQDGIRNVWEQYEGDTYEIAKTYQIAQSTVYVALREYCIQNNLVYREFLRYPHKPHKPYVFKVLREKKIKVFKSIRKFKRVKNGVTHKIDDDLEFILAVLKSLDHDDIEGISECAQMLIAKIDCMRGEF